MVKFLFDYDSTIANTSDARIDAINKKFGTHYHMGGVTTWYNDENGYMDEAHDGWSWGPSCFLSPDWQLTLPPVEGAIEGIHKLYEQGHSGMIVSDRPAVLFECTREWLDNHGLEMVRLLFTRHKDSKSGPDHDFTKSQAAFLYRLTHVWEDAPHHSLSLARRDYIQRVILLDTPYNQGIYHPKIVRVSSWKEGMTRFNEPTHPFWSKIVVGQANECWPFVGCKTDDGYGSVSFEGKAELSHRVAYSLGNNVPFESLRGTNILHTCDNPPCCNPKHLVRGTQQENIIDMVTKHRNLDGEKHQFSRLKEADIPIIFALKDKGYSHQKIDDDFNIDKSVVTRILGGNAWQKTTRRLGLISAQ